MKKAYEIYPFDNAFKAYLLGFLACDSSLYEGDKMRLDIIDEPIIKLFAEIMDANYSLQDKYNKETDKTYHYYRLRKSIKDIIKIYSGRKKADRIIPYDSIPKEYLPFLMQGIFDADGTIRNIKPCDKYVKLDMKIASSENIVYFVYNLIKDQLGIEGRIYDTGTYLNYHIFNKYDFISFFQWIYNPLFIPLRRKYERVVNIIRFILDTNTYVTLPPINNYILGENIHPYTIKPFYFDN